MTLTETESALTENNHTKGLCCTNLMKDSPHEPSMMAGRHEQLVPRKIQDDKLVDIQWQFEASWLAIHLVWPAPLWVR